MSHQGLKRAAIAPRHVHQVLFVLFAAVVTLLVAQQFQRWQDHHAASAALVHGSISQHFSPVQAQAVADKAPALQRVEQIERRVVDDTAQPHWVF